MLRNLSTDGLGFWAPQNEQIELALSYGFASIDLEVVDFSEQVESRGMEKARRLIDSAQIKLGAFPLPVKLDASDEDFQQQLSQLGSQAGLAAEVGCTRSIVTLTPASDERPMHENFELHRARLNEVGQVLEASGIALGVDFEAMAELRDGKEFQFICGFDELSKLVDAVGRENVGLVVDAWQLYVSGTALDVVGSLSGDRIVYAKIASAPADQPAAQLTEEARLTPSVEGPVDLVGFVKALVAIQYEGPITPVLFAGQFQGKRRDQMIRTIGYALDAVWGAADLPTELRPLPAPRIEPQEEKKEEVKAVEADGVESDKEETKNDAAETKNDVAEQPA